MLQPSLIREVEVRVAHPEAGHPVGLRVARVAALQRFEIGQRHMRLLWLAGDDFRSGGRRVRRGGDDVRGGVAAGGGARGPVILHGKGRVVAAVTGCAGAHGGRVAAAGRGDAC